MSKNNVLINKRTGAEYKIITSMNCSDGHQGDNSYIFEVRSGDKDIIPMLIYIFSKMDLMQYLYRESSTRIFFGRYHTKDMPASRVNANVIVKYFYKICRYSRTQDLVDVLKRTIEHHHTKRISIYDAFALAHFTKPDKSALKYYSAGMDILIIGNFPKSIPNKDAFINAMYDSTINHIYYVRVNHPRTQVTILAQNEYTRLNTTFFSMKGKGDIDGMIEQMIEQQL